MSPPWIALVGPEVEENLGLRQIAACLERAGYRTELIPFNAEQDLSRSLAWIIDAETPPLMVGLSLAFQWRALDFLALAIGLREAGYAGHLTTGGHFATFADAELLRDFAELDSVCRQQADETVVELAAALVAGTPLSQVAGLALRGPDDACLRTPARPPPDLDALPWPDRRGAPARCLGHGIAPLVGSRGCYANCTFCCIAAWHDLAPGPRQALRDPDDVAAEMASMHHHRAIDVFVFHDDNFFAPRARDNLARIEAMAEGLERRGVHRFATVVKSRPTDVSPEVFTALQRRLRCLRTYVGIETDSEQGLRTLRRAARPQQNDQAMAVLRGLGMLPCFNMMIFDPDTTLASLEENVEFMETNADFPFNFGRTELYAGTPLLERMLAEGRARGDWLRRSYDIIDPGARLVYELARPVFRPRNFGDRPIANRLSGTRFDVEVARHFHPERFEPAWEEEAIALSRRLGTDSTAALREVIQHVRDHGPDPDPERDGRLQEALDRRLRSVDREVEERAEALELKIAQAMGVGPGLAECRLEGP